MSTPLQLGDRQLISLKEATLRVPYTRDYIARLAREGKIVAAQYNRQWYIDAESLQNFCDTAQLEVRARQEYVRELRRQELVSRENLLQTRQRLMAESVGRTKRSTAVAMQIFVLGLVVGVFIFLGATRLTVHYVPGQTASLGDLFDWNTADENITVTPDWYQSGLIIEETDTLNFDNAILLLPATTSDRAAMDIKAMFSDGVEVSESGTTTGTVRLIDEPSTTLQFVRISSPVPARLASSTK